jgi:hypothetical protein
MAKTGTGKPKAKAKPRRPKYTDKEQSERFIQAARDLGVDGDNSIFDKAIAKILSSSKPVDH